MPRRKLSNARRAVRRGSFTGSKGAAEKGELVYYVGGTDEALREARPILEASSKEIVDIGPRWPGERHQDCNQHGHRRKHPGRCGGSGARASAGFTVGKIRRSHARNASYSGTLAMKLPNMLEPRF